MKRTTLFPLLITAICVFAAGCGSNPATGGKNVVLGSWEGEKKTTQKNHQEIVKGLGLYDDQATQEYVNIVGQRVALVSDMPQEEFKFYVIDDEAINVRPDLNVQQQREQNRQKKPTQSVALWR